MNKIRLDKTHEYEVFSIEEDSNGIKQVWICGCLYYNDDEYDGWVITEGKWIPIPLTEFVENLKKNADYVEDLWGETQQSADYGVSHKETESIVNRWFDGCPPQAFLKYEDLTPDTEVGDYIGEY